MYSKYFEKLQVFLLSKQTKFSKYPVTSLLRLNQKEFGRSSLEVGCAFSSFFDECSGSHFNLDQKIEF
jgi:hypothetical protein